MLYDKEFSEKIVNTINENDSGYIVIREEIDYLSETKKVSIYCKEEIRMDLIEKLESNSKEVINTGGITLYKEMSFTKENSIIDYKVSNKITVGGITYIENVKDKLNFDVLL